jgi:ribosomal protein S16
MQNLIIKLKKRGEFHRPCYDIVLISRSSRRTKEKLGFYNPSKIIHMRVNYLRLAYRLNRGAYYDIA